MVPWFDSDLQEMVAAVDQDETKDQKATSTPPGTPVRAEEGKLSCHTRHGQHALLGFGFVRPLAEFLAFSSLCVGSGVSWLSSCLPGLESVHVVLFNNTTVVAMFFVITDQEAYLKDIIYVLIVI